jgi:RecJ-like exonuclease
MAETDVLSIRMSSILKARIRAEADKQGVKLAEFVAEACRTRLDAAGSGTIARHDKEPSKDLNGVGQVSGSGKPDIQALRDICAGKIDNLLCNVCGKHVATHRDGKCYPDTFPNEPAKYAVEIPICGKTWWEEGEHWECLMDTGHREGLVGKHGLRGMVRRLD